MTLSCDASIASLTATSYVSKCSIAAACSKRGVYRAHSIAQDNGYRRSIVRSKVAAQVKTSVFVHQSAIYISQTTRNEVV